MFRSVVLSACATLYSFGLLQAAPPPAAPLAALTRMPIKEVTVFKDGHAFVLHEGKMPTDRAGNVVLDRLPSPVLGTFWPYSSDKNARLSAVTAARRRVLVERTALTLRDLVEANSGAEAIITETNNSSYPATIVGFPTRKAEEQEENSPKDTDEVLPQKGNLLLLKTAEGTKAVAFERIQEVKFVGKYKTKAVDEEYRNLLTLKLDWGERKPDTAAAVGMVYLQKGIRWIPGYKVEIDGAGKALVHLQATLLNELTDLEDVSVNLVVGVPTFAFRDTTDPIALSRTIAQLSPYFDTNSSISNGLSNSIMTQTPAMRGYSVENAPPVPSLGPDVAGSAPAEDLFVYTVKHVTLRRGQRLVLPVAHYSLAYKDVYTLDIPFSPPPETRYTANVPPAERARLFQTARVMHKIRLYNSSKQPLTTAPALIVRDNRVLAQGMMTYTAIGASSDLAVTTAVDIKEKKTDKETKRASTTLLNKEPFLRIDLQGKICLTNYGTREVDIEVTRRVLGHVGEANQDGKVESINVLEDVDNSATEVRPYWWGWYNWPAWWNQFNSMGTIIWNIKLKPGKTADLDYTWYYYWR